jgi:hypothetical protein
VAPSQARGRYCQHGQETGTAEADNLDHLQDRRQADVARSCRGCRWHEAIQKAAAEFKVIASKLIAVRRECSGA